MHFCDHDARPGLAAEECRRLAGKNPPAGLFFWGAGTLSSLLDNAPTYLSFLSAVLGTFVDADVVRQVQHLVQNGAPDLAALSGPHVDQIL